MKYMGITLIINYKLTLRLFTKQANVKPFKSSQLDKLPVSALNKSSGIGSQKSTQQNFAFRYHFEIMTIQRRV